MDVGQTVQVRAIGCGLEESEFEVVRDFEVGVAGIHIAGRAGETVKVPYWVGQVMQAEGLGSLRMPDMITMLKQALSKERTSGPKEFPALDPLFYIRLKEIMGQLGERDYNKVHDMLVELFRRRSAKLVSKASSMKLNAEIKSKLAVEELAFYNMINATCTDFEKKITSEGIER